MKKYDGFDKLLLESIKSDRNTFGLLCSRIILDAADKFAVPDRWGDKAAWRVVDRRLQAMRKAGLIAYSKGKWKVCEQNS